MYPRSDLPGALPGGPPPLNGDAGEWSHLHWYNEALIQWQDDHTLLLVLAAALPRDVKDHQPLLLHHSSLTSTRTMCLGS